MVSVQKMKTDLFGGLAQHKKIFLSNANLNEVILIYISGRSFCRKRKKRYAIPILFEWIISSDRYR